MLLVPSALTRFSAFGVKLSLGNSVDMVTSATPLHHMQMPALPEVPLMDMFLGNSVGCIGEISALALLLGGIYLVWRKVITVKIPLAYLGTVAVLTLIFSKGMDPVSWMLYSLLSGGVVLAPFSWRPDYATSPVTAKGQIIYGIGCGLLTVIFRYTGRFRKA